MAYLYDSTLIYPEILTNKIRMEYDFSNKHSIYWFKNDGEDKFYPA